MKSVLFVAILFPLSVSFGQVELDAITRALSQGDAASLSRYFDQRVEVSILDESDVYAKDQAAAVLKRFFSANRPSSFSTVHKGTSSNNNSRYCIGNLVAGGKTYRVYIYLKNSGGQELIQELRFDEE